MKDCIQSLTLIERETCHRAWSEEMKKERTGFIRSGKVKGKGSFLLWSGKVREACSGQGQNSIFILQVREIFHFSPSRKYVQHFNN